MKVYLLKDVQGLGIAGEIVKVKEGYADNFLLPRQMAVKINPKNAPFYEQRAKNVENRKEVVSSKTSMLAEKIKGLKLTLKKKTHDNGKLYAAVSQNEVATLLGQEGVSISKSQVKFDKAIKEKGLFDVTIKLTSQLQPTVQLKVVSESGETA